MLGLFLHEPSLIFDQVIRNRVHLMKRILPESVQVVLRDLIIDMLELCVFVSPAVSRLWMLKWGVLLKDRLVFR